MPYFNYRISLTSSTGHHAEIKAFADESDAVKYCEDEAAKWGAGVHRSVEKRDEVEKYNVEVTDTYGGEANYCWVKRYEFFAPLGTTNRELVRRAKELHGWTGHRCETLDIGDMLTVRPRGMAQIMFIVHQPD